MNDIFKFFTDNWSAIEGLARNLAADLAVLWGLALTLAQVLKKVFPKLGVPLEQATLGVLGIQIQKPTADVSGKGMDMDD